MQWGSVVVVSVFYFQLSIIAALHILMIGNVLQFTIFLIEEVIIM